MVNVVEVVETTARETGFSGAVRVERAGAVEHQAAFGLANRAWQIPNESGTRFATASATKGLTALVVLSLVGEGQLSLHTPARQLLGDDLPLIDSAVTVEQLLAHRSGIGDYLDESEGEVNDYVMPVPVHQLVDAEDYLAVLDGYPQVFAPGERFAYNNSGFVVLALLAERCAGTPYHQLVEQRVCQPAGMADTSFLRSDELPRGVAAGYLEESGLRTNVLHLPVRGVGDGGAYSTVADMGRLWSALLAGRIIPSALVEEALRPHSDDPKRLRRYGLGFWLHATGPSVALVGYDAGVSFRSLHDPATGVTYTVVSNTSSGAWPMARALDALAAP